MDGEVSRPHIACYKSTDSVLNGEHPLPHPCWPLICFEDASTSRDVVFVDKSANEVCYLLDLPCNTSAPLQGAVSTSPLPASLKIDASVLDYANDRDGWRRRSSEQESAKPPGADTVPLTMHVQFSPGSLKNTTSSDVFALLKHKLTQAVASKGVQPAKLIPRRLAVTLRSFFAGKGDGHFLSTVLDTLSTHHCGRIHSPVTMTADGFDIPNAHILDISCLLGAAAAYASLGAVVRISLVPVSQVVNYAARGCVQSGVAEQEPFSAAGFTGAGQVIGIADSGLDDSSAFFMDDSGAYPTVTTSRSGILEPFRRKVIQYIPYADGTDDEGGHGTHVSGSLAGALPGGSNAPFGSLHGMAPKAKISFFDIGVTQRDYLKVPPLHELFGAAFASGARVHSNSWGNLGGLYGPMARDLDAFVFDHQDMLIIFAAGNNGPYPFTIISPGNAKNALTVGALTSRDVFTDLPSSYRMADFSSTGPTFDGRIKPDIVAPGESIVSAYATAVSNQSAAQEGMGGGHSAVHQMSGTSMATPMVAGMVLLLREYLMTQKKIMPSGYLLKGMVIHSGVAVDKQVPDTVQGYGRLQGTNLLRPASMELFLWEESIAPNSAMEVVVTMDSRGLVRDPDGGYTSLNPLKITLCWYDPPHVIGITSKLLLHDLDLFAISGSGGIRVGNRNREYTAEELAAHPYSDDRNPNEQITFYPKCKDQLACTVKLLVQSYALPCALEVQGQRQAASQTFALVVTANGTVTEPMVSSTRIELATHPHTPSEAPVHTDNTTIHIASTLPGNSSEMAKVLLPQCAILRKVEVNLLYTAYSAGSRPSDLELTIMDPRGQGLAVGNGEVSIGRATASTEWPNHWQSHANGSYAAVIEVSELALGGAGDWEVYALNTALASTAEYDLTVTLLMGPTPVGCNLMPSPARTVAVPLPAALPRMGLLSREVQFKDIALGVSSSSEGLLHDTHSMSMHQIGLLDSIELSLNASKGSDAWLLDVIVTSPNGLTAQVGGLDWNAKEDHFYSRRWPDDWIGRMSKGDWLARRDLHAAGLASTVLIPISAATDSAARRRGSATWTIELAVGYPYGVRKAASYSGTVRLLFRPYLRADPPAVTASATSAVMLPVVLMGLLLVGVALYSGLIKLRRAAQEMPQQREMDEEAPMLAPRGAYGSM